MLRSFCLFMLMKPMLLRWKPLLKGESQLPNKTNVALQFYEGALLAIDSLKKLKLNAKIFVFDVDDSDSCKHANLA
jgi:hypothetical protein